MAETLRDLGEFGLIARLTQGLPASPEVLLGVGDDCAVVRGGKGVWLLTCDASLEGVHFRRETASPEDIGWKAAASAISDIAAMGGYPRFALVSLSCTKDISPAYLERVYDGLRDVMRRTDTALLGGDTTASRSGLVLSVTVIGEAEEGRYRLRSGAQPGDVLLVTGPLGGSAGGFLALEKGLAIPELTAAHLRPEPRLAMGQWLAGQNTVHALIDLSDGLVPDAGHLAESSRLAFDIDVAAVPVAPALAEHAVPLGCAAETLALSGGEDYELALAADGAAAEALETAFYAQFGLPLYRVGRAIAGAPEILLNGKSSHPKAGYRHFGE